jgi:hypothetical protein
VDLRNGTINGVGAQMSGGLLVRNFNVPSSQTAISGTFAGPDNAIFGPGFGVLASAAGPLSIDFIEGWISGLNGGVLASGPGYPIHLSVANVTTVAAPNEHLAVARDALSDDRSHADLGRQATNSTQRRSR